MSNRLFAALLAGLIMLLSAGVLMRQREGAAMPESAAASEVQDALQYDRESFLLPAEGSVKQRFGAAYSDAYAQWTMQTELVIEAAQGAAVYAPLSGRVCAVEVYAGGGSCVTISCGTAKISLYPVDQVSVFSGSTVERGDVIGSTRGELFVSAEQEGSAVDPQKLEGEATFQSAAGERSIPVE